MLIMPPISFSDEEIELLSALAAALQPAVRGTFLTIVGNDHRDTLSL
jgi:hypothetical protein